MQHGPVRCPPLALTETSVLAVIPARYHSTRFPGKPLADLDGLPMIVHVYRRALQARLVDAVIVATDDARIVEAIDAIGGHAWLTRPDHPSGTDRLAEVAAAVPCHIVVNVQGDEPLIPPEAIDAAIQPLLDDPRIEMSTLSRPLAPGERDNPHVVKVVCRLDGRALYFSRAAIPHRRGDGTGAAEGPGPASLAHVGLYVYRRTTLLRLATFAPTALEQCEALEQLRALEHGIDITLVSTTHDGVGVDTPEDLERVRQHLLAQVARS